MEIDGPFGTQLLAQHCSFSLEIVVTLVFIHDLLLILFPFWVKSLELMQFHFPNIHGPFIQGGCSTVIEYRKTTSNI